MRKFADGGFTPAQEEWLGGADRTDPYILARMRSAIPDEAIKKPIVEETSADLDPYGAASKKPAAVEKTVVKTKVTPSTDSSGETRSDSVKKVKEAVGSLSFPKSFTEAGGKSTIAKSKAELPSVRFKMPDPLANFDLKGKRFSGRDVEDRKKGGVVKKMSTGGKASASRRGDGIAQRGKTRGRIV